MNDFIELMSRRHSCRKFSSQPVDDKKIVACINAARLAPSAMNAQAWHFYVANDPEKSKTVAELVQVGGMNQWASACPAFIVVAQTSGNVVANIASCATRKDFRQIDMGLATMALTLEAEEQGLGTCILGIFDEEKLKKTFRIPSNIKLVLVIAVGSPDEGDGPHSKKRKELDEIISYL